MASGVVDHQRVLAMVPATFAIAWLALACEPTVVIGSCSESPAADAGMGDASSSAGEDAVAVPWSTGFEDGLCGYHSARGYCYARHGASIEIVETPLARAGSTGKFVAAFTVNADDTTADRSQARCVQQGVMPKSAVYGAWYFIPALATSDGNWNLFHFLGRTSEADSHALWDISLKNNSDGQLELSVFNFLTGTHPPLTGVGPIPIGRWFQIEIRIVRSALPNGEVTVQQDGVTALHLTKLITDDTQWGQWYVGNFVKKLEPASSTVYVDDVSIREAP
ncbi:MAG TPA: hypothetical protein VJV79_13645 [Polyangiaceae bacterium]|nr:hypothetical protein [Polyangiaceae bacterium]